MSDDEQFTVTRDETDSRYEIHTGDILAGYTVFEPDERGRLVFPHTVIDPAFKGKGLGSVLVAEAMADVARRGETVVPRCPFVVRYLNEHEVPGLQVDWPTAGDTGADAVLPDDRETPVGGASG